MRMPQVARARQSLELSRASPGCLSTPNSLSVPIVNSHQSTKHANIRRPAIRPKIDRRVVAVEQNARPRKLLIDQLTRAQVHSREIPRVGKPKISLLGIGVLKAIRQRGLRYHIRHAQRLVLPHRVASGSAAVEIDPRNTWHRRKAEERSLQI